MNLAIATLRSKGVIISAIEEEATLIAILLHDAGHGPFSHALENSMIKRNNPRGYFSSSYEKDE